MKDPKDFYLTTAITYTSGKPHIGNTGTLTVAEPLILKNVDYNVIFLSNFLF